MTVYSFPNRRGFLPTFLLVLTIVANAGRGEKSVSAEPAGEAAVSDTQPAATESRRIANGDFELGAYGWSPRYSDTFCGEPNRSWHGPRFGMDAVWKAGAGVNQSGGLVFQTPLQGGTVIRSEPFLLQGGLPYRFSAWGRRDQKTGQLSLFVRRMGESQPTAVLECPLGNEWQNFRTEFVPRESGEYFLAVAVGDSGPDAVYLDRILLVDREAAFSSSPLEAAVDIESAPDGIVPNDQAVPLRLRIDRPREAAERPANVRLQIQDVYGRVFHDETTKIDPSVKPTARGDRVVWTVVREIPPRGLGFWRVRVTVCDGAVSAAAECPVFLSDARVAGNQIDRESFFGSEWLPTDQANRVAMKMGIKWIKLMNIGSGYAIWPAIEKRPGQFTYGVTEEELPSYWMLRDFSYPVSFVERIEHLRKHGILCMAVLVGAPPWENAVADSKIWHQDFPKNIQHWEQAVARIVRYYRGKIPYYEIWNEPGWWDSKNIGKTYRDYAALVRAAIRAIRKEDPSAGVVYMSYTYAHGEKPMPENRQLERELLRQVDVVSFHTYFRDGIPPDESGDIENTAKWVRERKKEFPHLQFWNTEGGIVSGHWHRFSLVEDLPFPRPAPFKVLWDASLMAKLAILYSSVGVRKHFFYIHSATVGSVNDAPIEGNPASIDLQTSGYGYPNMVGGATAIYSGLLHQAKFVRVFSPRSRVCFYLYERPDKALAFYWGKFFGNQTVQMHLEGVSCPSVLDMFGNPQKIPPASEGGWNLPLSGLVNILEAKSVAELENLIRHIRIPSLPEDSRQSLLQKHLRERFDDASNLPSEQWYSVDLSRFANRAFADSAARDGQGGWTDQGPANDLRDMPLGSLNLFGIPFQVLNPEQNGGRGCIVLHNKTLEKELSPEACKNFPREVSIPVHRRANVLYFLLGAAWAGEGGNLAVLHMRNKAGEEFSLPLIPGRNIADWHLSPLPDTEDLKSFPVRSNRFLYVLRWRNPRPEEPIECIRFVSADDRPIPILIAVTGHGR